MRLNWDNTPVVTKNSNWDKNQIVTKLEDSNYDKDKKKFTCDKI